MSADPVTATEDGGTAPLLDPLLATRASPAKFEGGHQATEADVEALLEAARWAPSAGNSQPWAFIVGLRGDETHSRLVRHLARSVAAWAPDASILVANLAHRWVAGTQWEHSEFSLYDLGQAVAHMTVQARALGLHVRQFRAFDRDAIASAFSVPSHWEVATMSAIGVPPAEVLPTTPRVRRPRGDLVWPTGR